MMPDKLFHCEASSSVASSPASEVLKTMYEKDLNDPEGVARQVLLPTNKVKTHYNWKLKSHAWDNNYLNYPKVGL